MKKSLNTRLIVWLGILVVLLVWIRLTKLGVIQNWLGSFKGVQAEIHTEEDIFEIKIY